MEKFSYDKAFSRNIGWTTPEEQKKLRSKKVAIAGMGGVGGIHLLTLARLGISKFHISDFDSFDQANFNRQAGAFMSTVGKPKVEVMRDMLLDINPAAEVTVFERGIDVNNVDDFLSGVDLYVDGLDFFVLDVRQTVYRKAYEANIHCICVAPIAMGAGIVNICPKAMNFDDYFGLSKANDPVEKALMFAMGLSPKTPHRHYIADDSGFDFEEQKVPSTAMGCQLAAGFMGTEALKVLLGRGRVVCAPRSMHFDAYSNRVYYSWLPWGYRNWFAKLKLHIVKQIYRKTQRSKLK